MHVLQEVGLAFVMLCLTVSCRGEGHENSDVAQNGEGHVHSAITAQNGEGHGNPDSASPSERHRRNADRNTLHPFQELVSALQGNRANSELYLHFTPSTPAPQNINCYVEVPTTVRQGGQCVQLGMGVRQRSGISPYRPWACQAGIRLEVSSHCQNLMHGRSGRQDRG